MSDTSNKKDIKKVLIPDLPKVEILGEVWEYRARSPELLKFVEEFENTDIDKSNPEQAMTIVNNKYRELLEKIFVKGNELYDMIDKTYRGDVGAWLKAMRAIMQVITHDDLDEELADLQRFKEK